MLVIATELRIKNIFRLPLFIRHSIRSVNQSLSAGGNLKTNTSISWLKGYTLTVWNSHNEMLAFRNTGHHKEAMKQIRKISYAYKSTSWETDVMPTWKDAKIKLESAELKILN